MFCSSLVLGVYSILILLIGYLSLLTAKNVFLASFAFLVICFFVFVKQKRIKQIKKALCDLGRWFYGLPFWGYLLIMVFFFQIMLNFIGAISPEVSFDALWYHLTIPKIFIEKQRIFFIPGGLLYYSVMPALTEMFYLVAILFANEIFAKLIHFGFGLLAFFMVYKTARLYLAEKYSFLTAIIFYTMPVVGWLSTAAYIDLSRTFFEVLGLFLFLNWYKTRKAGFLVKSGLVLGFALGTKLLAFGSIAVFLVLLVIFSKRRFLNLVIFSGGFVVTSFIWFVGAYWFTGNFFYPLFTDILDKSHKLVSFGVGRFIGDFFMVNIINQDPLTCIILILAPLVVLAFGKLIKLERLLFLYCCFAYVVWYLTPRTGGGRFILPYIPAFIILTVTAAYKYFNGKIWRIAKYLIFFSILGNVGFRIFSSFHFLPFILGKVDRATYLKNNLDFGTNVFFDVDGFFEKRIKKDEKVLIYCSHNLYYVNFPFIHESWYKGEKVDYVLTQNCQIPEKFNDSSLIYKNSLSGVKLYKL